ncbi:trigger factor [Terricaulis sp.]|uniref:trigger factor n=1 Tax=Terricaulis sp. TaxID=2768686 RepID=UPI002AC6FDCF|nr:trigger factor [Terricaulis sp.]MDZ4692368.1 trigger factor [Terricaulis sp.]
MSKARAMQLTERRSEGLLRVYDVVVPAAELQQKLNAKIAEVQPRVRINGFRPGKVPVSHIRKVYGPGMMQDIINETVQKSTKESLDKVNARPASEPSLDLKSDMNQVVAGTADLQFELSLEVMPDFEPIDLKTISITRPVTAVADAQVDEALAELARANRGFEDKDGAAADGDALIIDFIGRIDGEAFDGGAATDAQVVIGSNQFIPGFEEQLVGAKAGDERTLKVSFPDDYPAANLKGKAAEFETKVKSVRAPKAGAPDDAWAAELGFDSLNAIKDALRQRIESEHKQQSRAKAKRQLFDQLDAQHDFELPPRMVEAEFNQIWRQIEQDRAAGRLDPSDEGKSDDDLKAEYRDIAERRVRLGLLLAEIGRRHKIEVSDQEVAQAISVQARNFPGQERQIFEAYQRNPQLVAQVRAPIYEEKVVDYVMELIKVSDENVDRETLFAEDDAPTPSKKAKKTKA